MPVGPLLLLVYVLAVARVAGLVVEDVITARAREKIVGWLDDKPGSIGAWFADLLTCQWCASVWISGAAIPLIWFHGDNQWMIGTALVLAFSQVVGMISSMGR